MRAMHVISLAIFLYEALTLIRPLRIRAAWKVLGLVLLLAASFKNVIYQAIGGGMFFAPEVPRWAMLGGASLYSFLIVALFLSILKDALWIAWRVFVRSRPFPSSSAACAVLIASACLTLWGTWEAVRVPDVVERDLILPGLHPDLDGLRVALIVDLHASALNRRPFVQGVVDATNAASPDVVLMPGDFVDGSVEDRSEDVAPLAQLRAPFGVWGTSGNHEWWSGYEDWMEHLEGLGISMLENGHVVLTSGDGRLTIAGVPDRLSAAFGAPAPDPDAALRGAPRDVPIILMAHQPRDAEESARAGATIQFSGHTHGGHMPILDRIIARFNEGYVRGWYDVASDGGRPMRLWVSPGTSLWNGFPLRLFDPAEISLFTLRAAP